MRRVRARSFFKTVFCCLIVLIFAVPVLYMFLNSFIKDGEFSLNSYYQLLLSRPFFLAKFWNSLILSGIIVAGQAVVSCMAGFAFAKYAFRGKHIIFFLLVVLMILPVQSMLVPNYIMFDRIEQLDTWWPLIVSGVFTPFGTFLMTQVFRAVPNEIIEASRIDGAGTVRILVSILTPAARVGFISLALLVFIDSWNMVEQPIAFLSDASKYPLSVFLAYFNRNNIALSFACGVLSLLPGLHLFLYYRNELTQGIEYVGTVKKR